MNKNYLTLSLLCILIVGCGSDTPNGSDDQVVELTDKIFEQEVKQVGSNTPSCSSPQVIELINKIFEQEVEQVGSKEIVSATNKNTTFGVSKILLDDINEKTGRSSCQAILEIILPEGFNKTKIQENISLAATKEKYLLSTLAASLINIDDRALSSQIKYSVSKTLDSDEVIISLDGHQMVAFITSAIMETGKFNDNILANDSLEANKTVDENAESTSIDMCVDNHIEEFRKEHGVESTINNDVLEEWEAICSENIS